jgi:phage-related protein
MAKNSVDMTQSRWVVVFYEKPNGERPAEEFLDGLTREESVRIGRKIGRLGECGPDLPRPDADHLRDKICELRMRCRKVRIRLLYWRDGDRFILSHGIKKKTDRVPDSEIDKAIAYREDYARRKEKAAG